MSAELPTLDPPERLLCGPGPTNVAPSVLAAMGRPMLGHLDPDMQEILLEVVAMLRRVYRMPDGLVLPLHCTGMAGMETGMANLLEPGDTAIVAQSGFFGGRIAEVARRYGVEVVDVKADWGEAVPNERLLQALDDHPEARLVAVVHAETSTGVEHPLAELAGELRGREVLLMADCVTSLGGVELDVGAWGIDYAYSCTQKCLAAPPGMSPVAVSEAAMERVRARTTPVPFSFDLLLLERYWIGRPTAYHHTAPILHIYALHEALRLALAEGLERRWARHAEAGAHLRRRLEERGLELLADPANRLAPLTAVRVPEGVDDKEVQTRMLREHGIEVGGGLGPSAPAMWRIGLMGGNADVETADRVFAALDALLSEEPPPAAAG
ncbi:MAG TPA: alanine--glyoxylate aminotransferase family protein [Thermoleophilaceae bacterium]|nr:alanine--glyoxylate aminotransferase family protein [Thermoleophilaceae bacterium]